MRAYIFAKESDPAVQQALAQFPGWGRVHEFGSWTLFYVVNMRLFRAAKAKAAQDPSIVRIVPALSRTLQRLPVGVQNFLNSHGVTFTPGDTVGDILAALTGDEELGIQ
ncbi:hypothetical protein LCGC14_2365170 [marine sediment metagenome]|uniref:Uncharacterized protein n=1 Tax=marine sediment metagenome TaxID=412755 RepID=A0A0F9C5C0_9ZZZZ